MQKEKGVSDSILYIEDDSANREIVVMFLKNHYMVETASDSTEAFNKLNQKKFAVILLDINLCQGLNGFELAKKIREDKNYFDKPIIAVTAHAFKEAEIRIMNCGCSDYITKPFTKKALLDKINKVLIK
ncbi:MAG: response regulator [bacterium]|nr:response regulator [bacterium]